MKHSLATENQPSQPAWQLLLREVWMDRMDIAFEAERIRTPLQAYHLPGDISEKIIKSIGDAVSRINNSSDPIPGDQTIFLNIYISAGAVNGNQSIHTWGFFHIERTDTAVNAKRTNQRFITFYLFPDE